MNDFRRIRMINNNVMVAIDPDDEKIGSFYMPEDRRERKKWGVLVAKSPRVKTQIEIGERVCVPWATGLEMTIDKQLYQILDENEVMLAGS